MKKGLRAGAPEAAGASQKPGAFIQRPPMSDRLEAEILGGPCNPKSAAVAMLSTGEHRESPEFLAGLHEMQGLLRRYISEKLSPAEAELLMLSLRERPLEEMAARLGISETQVRSRRIDIVTKLARELAYIRPKLIEDEATARRMLTAAICPHADKDAIYDGRG